MEKKNSTDHQEWIIVINLYAETAQSQTLENKTDGATGRNGLIQPTERFYTSFSDIKRSIMQKIRAEKTRMI